MFSNAKKLVWLSEEVAQHKVRGRHQASDTEGQKIQNTKAQTPLRTKATAVNIALINFLGCVTVLIVSLPTGSGLHNSLPFRDSDWWCWHSGKLPISSSLPHVDVWAADLLQVESLLIYPAPSGEIPSSCGLKTINYIGNTQDQRQALKNMSIAKKLNVSDCEQNIPDCRLQGGAWKYEHVSFEPA